MKCAELVNGTERITKCPSQGCANFVEVLAPIGAVILSSLMSIVKLRTKNEEMSTKGKRGRQRKRRKEIGRGEVGGSVSREI